MALELRQLRHVLALAQHRSFGRAATALHMTQPALSRSLKLIEWEVGSMLFERSAAGVTPTDQGRLLIRRARELVDAADELDREVLRQRVGGTDQISVGAGPYAAETIVAATLARFVPRNDHVRVRVTIRGNFDELPRLLRGRQLDFFVAEFSTFAHQDDLEIQPLEPHQGYFVAREGHPLVGADFVPESLFEFPFLALAHYPPRALEPLLTMREPVNARQPSRPFPTIECTSLSVARSVLHASDAIAGLTLPLVADDIRRGSLVVLGTAPWCYIHYGIVGLKANGMSSACSEFLRELHEAEAALASDEARLIRKYSPQARVKPRKAARSAAGR